MSRRSKPHSLIRSCTPANSIAKFGVNVSVTIYPVSRAEKLGGLIDFGGKLLVFGAGRAISV
jgi:hypothetical protein